MEFNGRFHIEIYNGLGLSADFGMLFQSFGTACFVASSSNRSKLLALGQYFVTVRQLCAVTFPKKPVNFCFLSYIFLRRGSATRCNNHYDLEFTFFAQGIREGAEGIAKRSKPRKSPTAYSPERPKEFVLKALNLNKWLHKQGLVSIKDIWCKIQYPDNPRLSFVD